MPRRNKSMPGDIYMRIEAINRLGGSILADFVESSNFETFNATIGRSFPLDGPTMIYFKNYFFRKRVGTVYLVRTSLIENIQDRMTVVEDSFIIRLEIDLSGIKDDIFFKAISHLALFSKNPFVYSFELTGSGNAESIRIPRSGQTYVKVRNVGQGSWNEVYVGGVVSLVFDVGTHYFTKSTNIVSLFGKANDAYCKAKPGLIISHWDVDHYHLVKAMTDATISAFAFILCRNFVPSLMSRVILTRLSTLNVNCYAVPADTRTVLGSRETPLFELYSNNRFVVFNSGTCRNGNKNGLSLLLRTVKNSIILPADQHYRQINNFVIPAYLNYAHKHNIIVPHHGGNAGPFKYVLGVSVKKGLAVISVGKNSYGHPFPRVIQQLRMNSFQVQRTDMRNDIDIPL